MPGHLPGVNARALRRKHVIRETLGYLALPAVYGALMAAGVFVFSPTLVALSFALVVLLLLQLRSAAIASAIVAKAAPAGGKAPPRKAVEAADARFLAQVNYTLVANVAAYLVFLAGMDLHVRALAAGAPPGAALLIGAVAAVGVVIGGREAARRAAWAGFEARHPSLWASQAGLDNGKATRSASTYFDWRSRADQADD